MGKYLRAIIAAFFLLLQTAQSATIEELFSNVAFLSGNGKTGTGFFVKSKEGRFLITANHVAEFMTNHALIAVGNPRDKKPVEVPLSEIRLASFDWLRHSNTNADVAILPLRIPSRLESVFANKFLDETNLWVTLPGRNAVLTVIGFPKGLGVQRSFAPLSRESKAASGILAIPWTTGVFTGFLLDKGSIGGYSGSPVFDLQYTLYTDGAIAPDRDSPIRILGLVQGYAEDMTAVVPAALIRELLSDEAKKVGNAK